MALVEQPWVAIGLVLAAFLALFLTLAAIARGSRVAPEVSRKLFHVGSGLLTLSFPFLFRELWPVLLLTGASAVLLISVRHFPVLRTHLGHVAHRVDRTTRGDLYFPIAVLAVFWLSQLSGTPGPTAPGLRTEPLLFVIPILMLTLADATGALVGGRYGRTPYVGASKSLEGSIAFLATGFLCVHVPLLLWSTVGRTESLLIASTLALLVMLLEGSAWRGLDNLFVPIGGFFLLRAYLPMDAAALWPRLLVTLALVALIMFARRRTTLEDAALVAGAFFCYVAWAVMGWVWLMPPMAVVAGYRWLSPHTSDNRRRIHDVPAMLSIWAPAVIWLVLARARGDAALLFPYTVAFGAHLAMFGTSRLAAQFPGRSIASAFGRAVIVSGGMVMIPYLLVTSAQGSLWLLLGAMASIAIGTAAFVRAEPDIRHASLTSRRWVSQGAAAAVASATGWVAMSALHSLVS